MSLTDQIAKLLRDVHFGGNWTWSDLKKNMEDVNWEMANRKVFGFNSIGALVYHSNYYVCAIISVLQGNPLESKDIYSFNHPPIESDTDWQGILNKSWKDADTLAQLIENMPEEKLWETFPGEQYGNYYRNIHGVIEHLHYHLGQMVLIKKIILQKS